MEDLISVIVPIYNIEPYVNRCVESVVKQTYSNLEIILVDDGSEDNSPSICDKWKEKDSRIVVIHKANGGLSDARNAGMKISHGKFYSFVDGDDEMSPNMLERLYKALRNTDSDVSMCRMEKIEACKSYVTRKYKFDCKQKILSSKEAIQLLLKDELDCSACLKLYSANVFGKIEFPFGKTNEDFAVMYKVFANASKIVYIPDILYHYYFRENSITSTKFNRSQFDKIDNCLEMIAFVEKEMPDIIPEAKSYLYRQSMYLLKTICLLGIKHEYPGRYMQLVNILRKGSLNIIQYKWLSVKERGMYLFIAWMPDLYVKWKEK